MKGDDKLNKIRSRLNIDELDSEDRSKLFKDFQNAGGKIVSLDDKEERAENSFPKPIKESVRKSSLVGNHSIRSVENINPFNTKVNESNYNKNKKNKAEKEKKVSWFLLFFLRMNCFFNGIFNFSGTQFSSKFIELILKELYDECILLKLTLDPIFKKTTPESLQFRHYMYQKNLLADYENAYHTYKLMDLTIFSKLQNALSHSVTQSEGYIKELYALYYVFYQYSVQIKVSTANVLSLFSQQFPEFVYPHAKKDNLTKVFNCIWSYLFPKLEMLIDYYWTLHNFFVIPRQSLDEYLALDAKEIKIGALAEMWKTEYLLADIEEGTGEILTETKTTPYPNDSIAKGISFILNNVNFKKYYQIFKEGTDSRILFHEKDLVFYAYVLVDYFDSEFSLLWHGNTVNFYVVLDGGSLSRFDAKKEIQILHNKINQFYELVNEYLRTVKTVNSLKKSMNKMKKKEDFNEQKDKELSRSSFTARQTLESIYTQYVDLLTKIIESKKSSDPIIGNWDEIINTHGDKVMNEKTIEYAIQKALEYTSAVSWLLKYSDLSGLSASLINPQILKEVFIDENKESK